MGWLWIPHSVTTLVASVSQKAFFPVVTWGVGWSAAEQDTHRRQLPSALQIDDKQLRGYLSELRPVTIVFVNLMFKEQDKAEVIGSAIQAACVHITSVLKVFRGQINKVFMFDKVSTNYRVGNLPRSVR